jgi:hypothetical protein
MSTPPGDDDIGYGRPPKRTRFRKGESDNRNRRYPKRREGRLEMMMRLLLQPVEVTVSGETKRVPVLEAMLLQLEFSEAPAASSIRSKFEEWARQNSQLRTRTVFVDSDYTRALAAKPQKKDDDHDL